MAVKQLNGFTFDAGAEDEELVHGVFSKWAPQEARLEEGRPGATTEEEAVKDSGPTEAFLLELVGLNGFLNRSPKTLDKTRLKDLH